MKPKPEARNTVMLNKVLDISFLKSNSPAAIHARMLEILELLEHYSVSCILNLGSFYRVEH